MDAIKVYSERWAAEVLISDDPNKAGFKHVQARLLADSQDDALAGAQQILNDYATGKTAYIRAKPEAQSERDFATNFVFHRGYVRFSFKDEPGEWHYPDRSMMIPPIGETH